jgi:hypothetical protein
MIDTKSLAEAQQRRSGPDKFIADQMLQAAGYAALFAGMSEQEMLVGLYHVRNIKRFELAETLDADVAQFVADAFVHCIARGKAEIEAANRGMIQ